MKTKAPPGRTGGPAAATDRVNLRREQIYLAASRLFIEKGFERTSMSDIAKAVNVTKGGLYHFVDSKEDLLFTITMFGMDRLNIQVIQPALALEDPLARLTAILKAHVVNSGGASTASGNPLSIIVDELDGLTEAHRQQVEARKRIYLDLLRDTLTALAREDRLRSGIDITAAAFAFIGAIMWIARWWRPDGRLTLEETADQVTALLLNGALQAGAGGSTL